MQKRENSDHAFWTRQNSDKKNQESNTSTKKEVIEKTWSEDIEEEQIVVAPSTVFDVNQYLKYENYKQQPLLIMRYMWGILLDLSFRINAM